MALAGWIFYVNLPIGVIAFGVLAATLPARSQRVQRRIDYLGAGLLASALSAIVLLTTLGGTSYAWSSPFIIALILASMVLLIAFVAVERARPSRSSPCGCSAIASSLQALPDRRHGPDGGRAGAALGDEREHDGPSVRVRSGRRSSDRSSPVA